MALFRSHAITRRGLFRAGAATAATTTMVGLMAGCRHKDEETPQPTVVDERSATDILENFSEVEFDGEPISTFELPVGTLLHPGRGNWIPAITAGASAAPIVNASALSLSSGELYSVVTTPIMGNLPNLVIFDVRCSDSLFAWVEMDMLNKVWNLYACAFSEGSLNGSVTTLWTGDKDWDPPRFAVSDNTVIWQVMPNVEGSKSTESSYCYLWHAGGKDAQAVVESPGRFATPPAVSDGTVTLSPRVRADEGVHYGITAYSLRDDMNTIVDQLVLPQSVHPFRAVRMGNVFAFSIEATYSSGGLLGSMGTYFGTGDGPFLTLAREPSAPVAGKGSVYLVRSRSSYFVIDTEEQTYTILGATNRCVDYGEYPASEGDNDNFITYATVKDASTGYPTNVTARIFSL